MGLHHSGSNLSFLLSSLHPQECCFHNHYICSFLCCCRTPCPHLLPRWTDYPPKYRQMHSHPHAYTLLCRCRELLYLCNIRSHNYNYYCRNPCPRCLNFHCSSCRHCNLCLHYSLYRLPLPSHSFLPPPYLRYHKYFLLPVPLLRFFCIWRQFRWVCLCSCLFLNYLY